MPSIVNQKLQCPHWGDIWTQITLLLELCLRDIRKIGILIDLKHRLGFWGEWEVSFHLRSCITLYRQPKPTKWISRPGETWTVFPSLSYCESIIFMTQGRDKLQEKVHLEWKIESSNYSKKSSSWPHLFLTF